jgi:hypothetical protein
VRVTCVVVLKCVIMYCTVDKSHSSGASATQPRTMKDGKPPCKLFAAVFARCGSLSPPPHKKNTTRGGPHRGPGSNTQSGRGCLGAPRVLLPPTAAFCNKYGARSLAADEAPSKSVPSMLLWHRGQEPGMSRCKPSSNVRITLTLLTIMIVGHP